MTLPFLVRFACLARAADHNISGYYNYDLDQIVGLKTDEMTGSQFTEAKTDPTTDESTDR